DREDEVEVSARREGRGDRVGVRDLALRVLVVVFGLDARVGDGLLEALGRGVARGVLHELQHAGLRLIGSSLTRRSAVRRRAGGKGDERSGGDAGNGQTARTEVRHVTSLWHARGGVVLIVAVPRAPPYPCMRASAASVRS